GSSDLVGYQQPGRSGASSGNVGGHPGSSQLTKGAGWLKGGVGELAPAVAADLGRCGNRIALPPAMPAEVIGDTGQNVGLVVVEVAPAVAIAVSSVVAVAAGDELRHTHGAGIGAGRLQRVDLFLSRQQQVVLQFA